MSSPISMAKPSGLNSNGRRVTSGRPLSKSGESFAGAGVAPRTLPTLSKPGRASCDYGKSGAKQSP